MAAEDVLGTRLTANEKKEDEKEKRSQAVIFYGLLIAIFVGGGVIAYSLEKFVFPALGFPFFESYLWGAGVTAVIAIFLILKSTEKPESKVQLFTVALILVISWVISMGVSYAMRELKIGNVFGVMGENISNFIKSATCYVKKELYNVENPSECVTEEVTQASLDRLDLKVDEYQTNPTCGSTNVKFPLLFLLENNNEKGEGDKTVKVKEVEAYTYGILSESLTQDSSRIKGEIKYPSVIDSIVLEPGQNQDFKTEFTQLPQCVPVCNKRTDKRYLFFDIKWTIELDNRLGSSRYLITYAPDSDINAPRKDSGITAVERFKDQENTPFSDPGPLQIISTIRPNIIFTNTDEPHQIVIHLKNRFNPASTASGVINLKKLRIEQIIPNIQQETDLPLRITKCDIVVPEVKSLVGPNDVSHSKDGKTGNFIELVVSQDNKYLSEILEGETKTIICDTEKNANTPPITNTLTIQTFVTYEFRESSKRFSLEAICPSTSDSETTSTQVNMPLSTQQVLQQNPNSGEPVLSWPLRDTVGSLPQCLTSDFGTPRGSDSHRGIDIKAKDGTLVYASFDGRVVDRGYDNCGGNWLLVDHENGFKSKYYHLSNNNFKSIGDTVSKGQPIAYSGGTGNCITGAHLHYELIRSDGRAIRPCSYFGSENFCNCCSTDPDCRTI